MFGFFAERWRCFRDSAPGTRFQERYRRTANALGWRRWMVLGCGGLLCFVGVLLLVLPGPGVVLLAVGAFLLAEQSEGCARALDGAELRLRRWLRR